MNENENEQQQRHGVLACHRDVVGSKQHKVTRTFQSQKMSKRAPAGFASDEAQRHFSAFIFHLIHILPLGTRRGSCALHAQAPTYTTHTSWRFYPFRYHEYSSFSTVWCLYRTLMETFTGSLEQEITGKGEKGIFLLCPRGSVVVNVCRPECLYAWGSCHGKSVCSE